MSRGSLAERIVETLATLHLSDDSIFAAPRAHRRKLRPGLFVNSRERLLQQRAVGCARPSAGSPHQRQDEPVSPPDRLIFGVR